ncbi:unnamed protein product [Laminaria digitata]
MDTSLSVNVWVDAPDDAEDRAKESLARVLVTSLAERLDAEVGTGWLNPTEEAVWPLQETFQVAQLAFQGLNADTEDLASDDASNGMATADGAFTARAMVDAITAPDILSTIMERILQGRS